MERHKQNKHPVKVVKKRVSTVRIKKDTPKINNKNKVQIQTQTQQNIEFEKLQEEMRELKRQVHERIDKVEQEPKNIIIIGDEKMFHTLTNKFGSDGKAMQFLLDNITPEKSIDIVDKLYLEGVETDRFPIACTDGYRFRYLSRSGKIVDDKGGRKIVSKLESEIHTAMVEANSKLLREAGQHRTVYDIASLQEQVATYRAHGDQMKFREVLAKKVYNKGHPFFN